MMAFLLLEGVPGGARWRYVWGSCLAFVFSIQLITGILLMTAYSPSSSQAWNSVHFIQYQMDFGWFIRGLHHFGSQTMVVLIALHMLQVVIAGAHLPPREVNWWLGIGLLSATLGLSLTGYLLPWDQKGYWATRVATNIASNIPLFGDDIKQLSVGGPDYGNHTLTRFYALHVAILPLAMIVLIIAHITIFRRHGVTSRVNVEGLVTKPENENTPGSEEFWPRQAFYDMIACMAVFGVMFGLVLYGFAHDVDHPEVPRLIQELKSPAPAARLKAVNDLGEIGVAAKAAIPALESLSEDEDEDVRNAAEIALGRIRGLFAQIARAGVYGKGAELDAAADRDTTNYPARPEWYFLFLFQLLKYFPGDQIRIGTVYIPNGVMLLLTLLPLFGYGPMRKIGHFFGMLVMMTLMILVGMLTLFALRDDSPDGILWGMLKNSDNEAIKFAVHHQEEVRKAEDLAKRACQLAMDGTPVEGGHVLIRHDPFTTGQKLFHQKCGGCHNFTAQDRDKFKDNDEHKFKNWTGGKSASDLGLFGTKEGVKGILTDSMDNKFFGLVRIPEKDKDDQVVKDKDGNNKCLQALVGMKGWREEIITTRKDEDWNEAEILLQEKEFTLIAEWLAEQAKPRKDRDPGLATAGQTAFFNPNNKNRCSGCHTIEKKETGDDGKPLYAKRGGKTGPDLTNYGSAEWIRAMIMSPGHKSRYGKNNLMPTFRNMDGPGSEVFLQEFRETHKDTKENTIQHLSDVEREMIIRWILRDYRPVYGGTTIAK
jgi:quinol-cytochrome oxidoreductase complex cytochrome b subunit